MKRPRLIEHMNKLKSERRDTKREKAKQSMISLSDQLRKPRPRLAKKAVNVVKK